ncbi:MAG: cytochrome c, partial [Desulfobaccales bacterium]
DKDRAEYLDNKPDEKHAEPSGTKKITTMVEIDTAKGKLKGTFKDKIQEFKDLLRIKVSPKLEPMYKSNCCGCHGAKGDGDGPDKADLKPANFNNPKFWVGDVDQKIDQAVQKGHEEIPKKEITKLRNMKDDDLNAVKAFIKQAFGRYEVYKIINGNQYILQTGQYCDKIVLQTRSILEVLNMLSLFINVPTEHITEGLVKESPLVNKPLNGPGGGSEKMFYIEYGKERPSDAFVAVKYHEYWFYIVNGDFDSKNVFSSTAGILSLSETATPSTGAPVLTLPVQ